MAPLLETVELTRRFGGLVAVNAVTMAVEAGTVHGLIGPNGAGKSTTFDVISGTVRPSAGSIRFKGEQIAGISTERRVRLGICRTFQTPKLFEDMSVLETVATGCHLHGRMGIAGSMFSVAGKRKEEEEILTEAVRLLEVVSLLDSAYVPARSLSYGKRRLLEIARALATRPKLLLLDEVTSGLNPVETGMVIDLIRRLIRDGLTVMLVEHDMQFVMNLCDRITVLNFGSKIAEGSPREISENQDVITAYLGRPRAPRPPR